MESRGPDDTAGRLRPPLSGASLDRHMPKQSRPGARSKAPGAVRARNRDAEIERVARGRFGVRKFRPGQREVIARALAGRDTLGVMPTGSGKSLCFQVPALLLPGAT